MLAQQDGENVEAVRPGIRRQLGIRDSGEGIGNTTISIGVGGVTLRFSSESAFFAAVQKGQ